MCEITLVVPVHNTQKYIKECIDSLLNQTYQNFEIICIDSSTDNTTEILKKYEEKNRCIKLIRDSNNSYGYKINRGIAAASGDYIGIIDSDDYVKPEMFETLLSIIKKQKVDFVKSDYSSFFVEKGVNTLKQYEYNIDAAYYNRRLNCRDNPEILYKNAVSIWTGLYRKDFLLKKKIKLNESEGASFQDTGFSVLTHVLADSFYYINQSFYQYRTDNDGSSVKSQKKIKTIVDEWHWIEAELDAHGINEKAVRSAELFNKIRSYCWNYYRLEKEARISFANSIHLELKEEIINSGLYTYIPEQIQKGFKDIFEIHDIYESENDILKTVKTILSIKNVALIGAGKIARQIIKYDITTGIKGINEIYDNCTTNLQTIGYSFDVKKYNDIKLKHNYYIICDVLNKYDLVEYLELLGVNRKKIIVLEYFPDNALEMSCICNHNAEEHPNVSVIIPVYNVENYLEDCLLSVILQTYKNIEIICVNDGSTDNSLSILEIFAQIDKRIKILNQKNGGVSKARNNGLLNHKGKYVLFLDSDDMLRNDSISKLVDIALKNNTDMVYFDAKCIFENKELVDEFKETYYVRDKSYGSGSGKQLFAEMMYDKRFTDSACLMLYSSDFIKNNKLKFIEDMLYEDCYFSVLSFMKAQKIYHINEKFYLYRIRNNSTMTKAQNGAANLYGRIICLNRFIHFLHDEILTVFQNQMLTDFILTILFSCREIAKIISEKEFKRFLKYPRLKEMKFELAISGIDIKKIEQIWTLENLTEIIKSNKKIYIYGAGIRGKRFLEYLYSCDLDNKVFCFVVSDKSNNPDFIHGIPVKSVDSPEIKQTKSSCIFISPRGDSGEILKICKRKGFKNIYKLNDEIFNMMKS